MTDRLAETDDTADGAAPEPTPLTAGGGLALDGVGGAGPGSATVTGTGGATDTGTDTAATPTLHPTPGDLGDLTPEQLALTGQWTALAALAHHNGLDDIGVQALRQLARHAGTREVFRWLWAVLADQPREAWGELSHLPRGLRVPADLVQAVAAEVITPPSQRHRRAQAHTDLLHALDPQDAGTVQIAWAVLDPTASASESVVDAAVGLLGQCRALEVRDQILSAATAAARAQPPQTQRRAELVAALAPPLSPAEATAAFDAFHALTEARGAMALWDRPDDPQSWQLLQRLLANLPLDLLGQVLGARWLDEEDLADKVLTPDFLADLGQPVLSGLLEVWTSLAPPALQALTTALPELRGRLVDPAAIELIEHAHHVLPETALGSLRDRLAAMASEGALFAREIGDAPSRQQRQWAVLALQRAALASPPGWTPPPVPSEDTGDQASHDEQVRQWLRELSEPASQPTPAEREAVPEHLALKAWTSALLPGEFSQVVLSGLSDVQLVRLGMGAGLLVLRGQRAAYEGDDYSLQAVGSDLATVATGMDDERLAALLSGYFTVATSVTEVLVAAILAGPLSTRVAAYHAPAPTAELVVVTKAKTSPLTLPLERDLDVLEVTASSSHLGSVTALARSLDWVAIEQRGLLGRAAAALKPHPASLREAITQAVRSQHGPGHQAASPARLHALLEPVLDAAVPTGIRDEYEDTATLVEILIDAADPALHALAGRWLEHAAPTEAVVRLAIRADQDTALSPSPYAGARTALAQALCARGLDSSLDVEERGRALKAAADLDADAARQAALQLVSTAPRPLRRVAAQVLVSTPSVADQAEALAALASTQSDRPTRDLLEKARRQVTSDSTDQALTNLLTFLSLDSGYGDLMVGVLLPLADWHATFVTWVDNVRASAADAPHNYVNTLIVLADLLAEQAIAHTWMASSNTRTAGRASDLLGHNGKEDIGGLVRQQALLADMPWLSHLASLRDLRTAHPTGRGSTTPLVITDQDAITAVALTRRVTEGWVATMYALAGRSLPPTPS